VQAELESGRDREVAAAAPDRPEQVRVGLGVDVQEPAVGGDQLGGQQVVDGEAVLADEVADAAGERDSPDTDRAGVAEPGGEAVGADGGRVIARGQSRLGPRGASLGVDVQRPHGGEVEHDPAVGGAVPGEAVAAAADCELEAGVARERDDARHVGGVCCADDGRRPAVEPAKEDGACLVVPGVIGRDHPTVEVGAELRNRDVGGLWGR
jgi:hypothetical protein